jgi:HAD superfamily phosphoserine phosphatase-like hydrolase
MTELQETISTRALAVFDFDGTLIEGDALWAFLFFVAGYIRTLLCLAEAILTLRIRQYKDKEDPALKDHRTFIKGWLIDRLLKGKGLGTIKPAMDKLYQWQIWKPDMIAALKDHAAKGHHIVIASGSLDIYLPQLLRDLPHDAVICTEIEMYGDIIVGTMTNGNCVRQRKAELVAEYIAANGPFDETWGYGNFPHDVPMLNLMQYRILV